MQENSDYLFTTPSSSMASESLLFFDTFSHSSSEKEIFDLVQFPTPVIIDLIKIVPLGQPIEANIPGNVRLGATNPSDCEIKFFINDLSQQDADKMADLGKFHCGEKETDFNPPIQVQTDGLLLRGSYRTLTLAIFGQIAVYDTKNEDVQPIPSATSPPAQTPASPVASERDLPFVVSRNLDLELNRNSNQEGSESVDESTLKSVEIVKEFLTLENEDDAIAEEYSNSKDAIKNSISNEDMTTSELPTMRSRIRDKKSIELGYSNSLDNESYSRNSSKNDDLNKHMKQTQYEPIDKIETTNLNYMKISDSNDLTEDKDPDEWTFNPEMYLPSPLVYFMDPSLTYQERSIRGYESSSKNAHNNKSNALLEKDMKRIMDMFDLVDSSSDEWVTLIEEVSNDIANLSLSKPLTSLGMIEFLVNQICHGLDIEMALRQKQTGFKVRHLRAGIKLATSLFQCGPLAIKELLDKSVPHKLLELYDKDQMSLPLRLLIFRSLSIACDFVEPLEYIIGHKHNLAGKVFCINSVKERIVSNLPQEQQITIKKERIDINDQEEQLETVRQRPCHYRSSVDDSSQEDNQITCYEGLVMILLSKPTTRALIAVGNLIKKIRLFKNLFDLSSMSKEQKNPSIYPDEASSDGNLDIKLSLKGSELEKCNNIIQDVVSLTSDVTNSIMQPMRYLPAGSQFQIKPTSGDSHLAFYKWIKHFKILQLIQELMTTSGKEDIHHDNLSNIDLERSIRLRNLCLTLIQNIVESPRGIHLLLSEDLHSTTGNILNALRKVKQYTSNKRPNHEIDNCINTSLHREEFLLSSRACDISLRLAYNFKIFSCIDQLFHFHRKLLKKNKHDNSCKTSDSRLVSNNNNIVIDEPERILHQLYIISDHAYGLEYMIKHLSSIGNLDCLLRFLDLPDYDNRSLEFVKETAIDYIFELIGTFLRLNCKNNILIIGDEYLGPLMELSKQAKDKNLSARIKSFIPWLTPFDHIDQIGSIPPLTYTEDTFKNLIRIVRKSIPNHSIPFAHDLDFELPPRLITAVRILRHLCIPPEVESYIEATFDPFSSQLHITGRTVMPGSKVSISFMDQFVEPGGGHRTNQSWNMSFHQSSRNASNNNILEDFNAEHLNQISNLFRLFQPYDESICGELKYHYGIMKLYELEGLKRLLNTLRELIGNYSKPIHQSAALCGTRGTIVISYIHSVVILLQSIVFHLIDARGSEFQDTGIITVILEAYSLLSFVPKPGRPLITSSSDDHQELNNNHNANLNMILNPCTIKLINNHNELNSTMTIKAHNYQLAHKTKTLILSILMGYTQLCLSVSESEEKVISKSMWTKMLKEVIDFTMSNPVSFHHGLDALTKIIPAPLPSPNMMDSIDQEQLFKNINHRKLWSAHLHPLHQKIEQMISSFSMIYRPNIRALLYYFCNQLCDLSSNGACMVVKIITETLVSCALKLEPGAVGSVTSPDPQSTNCAQNNQSNVQQKSDCDFFKNSSLLSGTREVAYVVKMILNLLSNVITNQAFETAFANHLQRLSKKDEKLLTNLRDTLKYHEDYRPGDLVDDSLTSSNANNQLGVNSVTSLIESIKSMAESAVMGTKDSQENLIPPESLTSINLTELARQAFGDRFSISSNLKSTYRLKVLMDLKSREPTHSRHSNGPSLSSGSASSCAATPALKNLESSSSIGLSSSRTFDSSNVPYSYSEMPAPTHKPTPANSLCPPPVPYGGSSGSSSRNRSSGRSSSRPDSFRSRPQNTSRPPSIHVDDFVDLYGDNSAAASGRSYSSSVAGCSKMSSSDHRPQGSHIRPQLNSSYGADFVLTRQDQQINQLTSEGSIEHRQVNYSSQRSSSGYSKSKYMKLK